MPSQVKREKRKVADLIPNDANPRYITEEKFHKLVQSVSSFPEMLEARPIVIDEDGLVLGGNMRYKAATESGMKEVPVMVVKGWTQQQKEEFIIKDNASAGSWDWDILANQWDANKVQDWGVDVWTMDKTFEPITDPGTNYRDVTQEEIDRRAAKLAEALVTERGKVECMCPACGHEFLFQS